MRPAKENQFEQRDYLLAKLKNNFATLSPKFQTAARYMLDNPQEVPISSMRKIALYAGVQPSTLVRLAQLLGFDGWQGLRDVFAAAIRNGPQPYSNHAKQVVRANSTARMLSNIVDAQQKNLELWRSTGQENLSQAADLLAAAPNVYIAGFRACFPIAFSLHYVYRLFRPSVFLIDGGAGTLELELRALLPKDAMFTISFAPYSQEIIRVADTAHAAGCRIIALTDSSVSPIALRADCVLQFSSQSPSFFPSIASGVAAVEALVAQLLAKQGADGIKALEAAEGQLHQAGAYVAPHKA